MNLCKVVSQASWLSVPREDVGPRQAEKPVPERGSRTGRELQDLSLHDVFESVVYATFATHAQLFG